MTFAPKSYKIRDENHPAWWETPLAILLMPFAALVWIVIIALFICVGLPVGIVGASFSWLMKSRT